MNKVCIIMFLSMMLFASSALAFPLHGSNGVVNATVYGVTNVQGTTEETKDKIYVDMSASTKYISGERSMYKVDLVDSDDKMYPGNFMAGSVLEKTSDDITVYDGFMRSTAVFEVPRGAIIKRVRISPLSSLGMASDPFSIDWTGVPEISDENATLKFYGVTKAFRSDADYPYPGAWTFDLKISNNLPQTVEYSNGDFSMVDQFGWVYYGKYSIPSKILSNESLRFSATIPSVSRMSRPVALSYKNLTMDISAWT